MGVGKEPLNPINALNKLSKALTNTLFSLVFMVPRFLLVVPFVMLLNIHLFHYIIGFMCLLTSRIFFRKIFLVCKRSKTAILDS